MAAAISTKNTFVDIEEPKGVSSRRSASLPPCAKVAGFADCFAFSSKTCKLDGDSSTVGDALSSSGSTQEYWDTDVCSACSQATGTSEASTSHYECSSNQVTPVSQSAPYVPMCVLAPASIAHMMQVPRPASFVHMRQVPGPWEAFQAVAMAAITALTAAGQPELHKSCFGWQVVLKVGADQMHLKEWLLSSCQAAILSASEQSFGTYVVGYKMSPFMDSPLGFSALLAYVDRPSEVCWDILQWGTCRFEGSCRWRHTEQQATLNVMVVPASGEATELS